MARRSFAFLLALAVLASVFAVAAPASARSPISLGVARENHLSMAEVATFIDQTGVKPRLWTLWSRWGDRGGNASCVAGAGSCAFPLQTAKQLRSRGITPIIWWEPTWPGNEAAGVFANKKIANGKHDKYIKDWARTAKRFGKTVVVRLAHEMNGDWFEWSMGQHGNDPETFKKAWRRVVRLFDQVGARNVKFLWSPYPRGASTFRKLYPGNAYVDYVGFTSLNWGAERWKPLPNLLKGPMGKLRSVTRTPSQPQGKPVILPELGSNYIGGDKAGWIRSGYQQVYKKYPQIRGMVYLDVDTTWASQPDWRLIQPLDGSAVEAYRYIAKQRRFQAPFK